MSASASSVLYSASLEVVIGPKCAATACESWAMGGGACTHTTKVTPSWCSCQSSSRPMEMCDGAAGLSGVQKAHPSSGISLLITPDPKYSSCAADAPAGLPPPSLLPPPTAKKGKSPPTSLPRSPPPSPGGASPLLSPPSPASSIKPASQVAYVLPADLSEFAALSLVLGRATGTSITASLVPKVGATH